MADEHVAAVLEKYRLEYDELTELRRRVEARLSQVQTAITALNAAENREPLKFDGSLADACRAVLKGATQPMAPTEVRNGVVGIGFQLSSLAHDNPMASIHSVLKRFVDAGDAEKVAGKEGTKYRWTGRAQTERHVDAIRQVGDLLATSNIGTVPELSEAFKAALFPNQQMLRLAEEIAKATQIMENSPLVKSLQGLDPNRKIFEAMEKLTCTKPKKR